MGSTSFLGFSYPNLLVVFLRFTFLYHILGYLEGSGVYVFHLNLLKNKNKQKQTSYGQNRTTVNAIVRVSIHSRSVGALRAGGFIHAPGSPMGSKPWLACACERKRRPRVPGGKASADLNKLQQILTMVQLSFNLRNN